MGNLNQLPDYPLFDGLSEAELEQIASRLSRRIYAKGAYLYYPGNPGLYTYLLESGLVRLFFTNARGEEFLLNLAGPRQVFGLPLLLDNQARVLGAAAHQPTLVLVLARQDLLDMMERSPQFMRNIYQEAASSARKLVVHIRSLVTVSLAGRLAHMLLRLSLKENNISNEFALPFGQAELAGWLGASRGALNRALGQLQKLGLIRVEGQTYIILDRPGLQRMTEDLFSDQDVTYRADNL